MNARKQRFAVDIVASLGLLITIAVELFGVAGKSGSAQDHGRIFGLTMLIASGMWALDRVMHRLEALEMSQQNTVKSLESARVGWQLGELREACAQDSSLVHVRAGREVADGLYATFIPGIIRELESACKSRGAQIRIDDVSPVHDLLACLANALPDGGVWLGITLRERSQDWTSYDDAFRRFVTTIRERAERGEIHVGRIYRFSSIHAQDAMAEMLAMAHRDRVNVRTTLDGPRRDVSILYAPPERSSHPDEELFGNDLIRTLKTAGYRVLCVAEFDTREDGVIRDATLFGPEHGKVEELLTLYDQRWRAAAPISTVSRTPPPLEDAH